jgi:hypothetical protein
MKELTCILHSRPDGQSCIHLLHKEAWGLTEKGQQQWSMTCHCGFYQLIDDDTLYKWQMAGSVM